MGGGVQGQVRGQWQSCRYQDRASIAWRGVRGLTVGQERWLYLSRLTSCYETVELSRYFALLSKILHIWDMQLKFILRYAFVISRLKSWFKGRAPTAG